jgi:hypothetical protein
MKRRNNEKMNINEIMAMFVAYMQQQIEYTDMKIKALKEWESDECGCLDCEKNTISISEDDEPTYDLAFSKEWL